MTDDQLRSAQFYESSSDEGSFKVEVKGTEDRYARGFSNIAGNGPVAMVLADQDRGAGATSVIQPRPQGRSRTSPAFSSITAMASAMAQLNSAEKRRLRTVGAERSGRICHFPPTRKSCGFILRDETEVSSESINDLCSHST